MSEEASKLAGIIDGAPLSEAEAKALWKEFSEHMDANRGDMSGYAKKKGWFSVLPEYRASVEDELARLDAAVALALSSSPDFDRARTADRQGLGGAPPL